MKCKYFKDVVIILIYIIICIPAVFANKDPNKISVIENRGLAKKPSLESIKDLNLEYVTQLEAYIDDNIGFKQEAILLKTGVLYSIFKRLNVPNYFMGKDENLFYSFGNGQISNYQGKLHLTKEEVERLSVDLDILNESVKNRGGFFLFMPIPDKEGIYPEFYPDSVLRMNNISRVDCLTETMVSKDWFVNVKEALMANKGDKMLYYKNFDPTHWNMKGAWEGYKALMNVITSVDNDIRMLTEKDVRITYEKGPGTLERLSRIRWMGDIMQFDDELVSCTPIEGYTAEKDDGIPIIPLTDGQVYFHYVNKHIEGKTLLVVGDSYIYGFLLPLLAESFSDVYFIDFVNADGIAELQEMIQPDIVVFEVVDRVFHYEYLMQRFDRLVELWQ